MTAPAATEASTGSSARLEALNLSKSFPGVRALNDVSLSIAGGECVALLGENGAGKSTLIKILAGAHLPDSGKVRLDGEPVALDSPLAAQRSGIAVIHQELNLIPDLSIRDNLFLGRDLTRAGGWLKSIEERNQTRELLNRIGMDHLDPSARCRELTVAEQQGVEIAKALAVDARVLILDEPTAALSDREVDRLLEILTALKGDGIAILYVTHRLDEVARIADQVCVLRDGQHVISAETASLDRSKIIEHMVGRSLDAEFPPRPESPTSTAEDPPCLRVKDLTRSPRVENVSFDLHHGEVLGLAGLVGAGRTDLARLLFGAAPPDSGTIQLRGDSVKFRSPREAIRAGICLLTEDRKSQGLILDHSLIENFSLPNLRDFTRLGWLQPARESSAYAKHADRLSIRSHSPHQSAATLSGGNQQKVVLAKWLQRNADIIIFDEPTRGIDVGAKYEIYCLIRELAAAGKAIIMISSELPELIYMADRILVMREGQLTGEINDPATAHQSDILDLAMVHSDATDP